jgi:hypothetical protein
LPRHRLNGLVLIEPVDDDEAFLRQVSEFSTEPGALIHG